MGMFDYVKFQDKCPNCGAVLKEFQSKDGSCTLDKIHFTKVSRFYTSCDECGAWVEYEVKSVSPIVKRTWIDGEQNETSEEIEITPDCLKPYDDEYDDDDNRIDDDLNWDENDNPYCDYEYNDDPDKEDE